MKRLLLCLVALGACNRQPAETYGFLALLGRDTVSLESVTRRGNSLESDEVDRFPRVRQRHTVIELNDDGSIRHLAMDIHSPSEPPKQRDRRVEVTVGGDSVHITKRDSAGVVKRDFAAGGGISMAHLPQMYSLYELYFAAALRHGKTTNVPEGKQVRMRQFYIDREFDAFPLHEGAVTPLGGGKADIQHDWLAGTGQATVDSAFRLQHYSGERTTYKVEVSRLGDAPDVATVYTRFAATEEKSGGMKQLSVRDTARATLGGAALSVDYARPLARGRTLLGGIVPYDQVWRTGANAATQFTTSAAITLAGLKLAPGTYTLWTVPHATGVELVVNRQHGQWGTEYDAAQDLGKAPMVASVNTQPVEEFTISILPVNAKTGTLQLEWGPFRWTAGITVP
ncbi:MAG: hypothetical protein JWO05_2775 [Gemmatimonadetes bacterium]|nr:hypothetical protein [Gemmatimonadota bacterium]